MLKRLIDILGSLFGLIVLSPILFFVWVLIRYQMGSPVLFRQIRPGKNEVPFEMLKFRTMLNATGPDGNPLPDGERLTKLGRFLRSTSLDELPELWNVLKGEMSLVGPRPLLMEYLPFYSEAERKRHLVRPGITGLAQVSGRNNLDWDQRLKVDVSYVENMSLRMDLLILWKTIIKVLKREDVVVNPSLQFKKLSEQRGK